MTSEPLLHPHTKQQLTKLLAQPPHALAIIGPTGIGKATVANWLAALLLGASDDALSGHPYFLPLSSSGTSIGIEAVRAMQQRLTLQVASPAAVNRVVYIERAQQLTEEAQNALLKTLEEPPRGTVLLLTASRLEDLLPTVRSRLQYASIERPSAAALQQLLIERGSDAAAAQRLQLLSDRLPGLAVSLQADDQSHPLVQAVTTARQLLQNSLLQRLAQVDALAKDRPSTTAVLGMLQQMAHVSLLRAGAAERWQRVLRSSYEAQAALERGGQPKLVLTSLMLNL